MLNNERRQERPFRDHRPDNQDREDGRGLRGRRARHDNRGPFEDGMRGMRGPRGGGPRGGGRRGGPRAQRGDLRLSLLWLLAERPMHGYELMSEIGRRTGGVWSPSPGSIYPTLSLLQDEGLIVAESDGPRRTFTLTDAGRTTIPADGSTPPPWASLLSASDPALTDLRSALRSVRVAVEQVVEAGTDADRVKANTLLVDLRRELYLMLAAAPDPAAD